MHVENSSLRFLQFVYINETARDGRGTELFSVVALRNSIWTKSVWSLFVESGFEKETESRCIPSDKHLYAFF